MHEQAGTPRVGMLMDASRTYERSIIKGVLQYVRLHGPWIWVRNSPVQSGGKLKETLSGMRMWGVDGILWRESQPRLPVSRLNVPTLYLPYSRPSRRLSNIVTDDEAIGRMAAGHLLELGLRHFAFYGLTDRYYFSAGRKAAFARRIREADATVESFDQLAVSAGSARKGCRLLRLRHWLASLPRPFGLMLCTDDCCLDVFDCCHAEGIRIPGDAYVVGVGDDELSCDFVTPSLSSVALGAEAAGYAGAGWLDRRMREGEGVAPCDVVVHPLHVVQRRSSDGLAIRDPAIAMAVRFIRDNATRPMHVDDILRVVPLSRRTLYRRFERYAGCTLYDEIRRVRIDRAARMLLETNQSVEQVARSLGYEDAKNFSRLFTREKNCTPLRYRRQFA